MTTMISFRDDAAQLADADACWDVCLSRDTAFDGVFVVAVKTTGIYCRPSCSARKPKRENVVFLASNEAAEAAGFRACLRCKPRDVTLDGRPETVRRACDYLDADEEARTVAGAAEHVGVTLGQLQTLFRSTLGVTPQQYVEARRLERLKHGLRDGRSVTDAMYDAGYSSPSRLYEGASEQMGMTPATYRRGGLGMTIAFRIVDSPVGRMLVAATEKGVCSVQFGDDDTALAESLSAEYPRANIVEDAGEIEHWVREIEENLQGLRPRLDLPLDVQGTAFQWRVWRALQAIGYGEKRTYRQIAEEIGAPRAARAVGRACATNKVAVVIPCHRVVGTTGTLTGYAYGVERKAALLEAEERRANS